MAVTKEVLTTGKFKFDTTSYGVTDMSYNEAMAKIDLTDTSTTGDGKETKQGRAERTFSIDLFMDTSNAGPTLGTTKAIEIDFEGQKYAGSGSLDSKAIKATIDNGIKVTYAGSFDGAVTVTPQA